MNDENKKISVIMGIYNCGNTLSSAIESILFQTYSNWELIMCDDGSTDNTFEIANKYKELYPEKIVLIKNNKNMGLNFTLNSCLKFSTGDYIARMDGDDISLPGRFQAEIEFLNSNDSYAIVSCPMILFDEDGDWGVSKAKEKPEKCDLIYGTPFCHAPCMVRKEAYDSVHGYSVDKKLLRVEDYHLWYKMYKCGYVGYNLQEPLYKMRDDKDAYCRRKFKYRINEMRVKLLIYKDFNLTKKYFIYVCKPIIIGLLPSFLYKFMHRKKLHLLESEKYDT